jgi:hypothetical protein
MRTPTIESPIECVVRLALVKEVRSSGNRGIANSIILVYYELWCFGEQDYKSRNTS